MSTTLEVFDPPMCCSTGVCGPNVDAELARFAADLDWIESQGVTVRRFNATQLPDAFAQDDMLASELETLGEGALPLIRVNGVIMSTGCYPSRDELAAWTGTDVSASIFTDAVGELVAIGAAIASNCEPCFRYHYDKARKLGVSKEDMLLAVEKAQAVKETPAEAILQLAAKYLLPEVDRASSGSCCGSDAGSPAGGGCC